MSDPANGSTRYGVVTCGKEMPGPMNLGPCRLEPGHEPEPCRWEFAGGYVSVSAEPNPLETDPVILRYRRTIRRSARVAVVCAALSIGLVAYNVIDLIVFP